MKNITTLLALFLFFNNLMLAQMSEDEVVVEKNITANSSKVFFNDIETFKNQFAEWNVGNLHVYSREKNSTDKNYYFTGEKITPMFQQYLPKDLKKDVVKKGSEPYHIASIRGEKLEDYFILRINDGKSDNTIVLYELKNNQLKPKKTLAYFYTQGGRTFQMDTWIQDVNGDTRLDLIQKTQIKNSKGELKREVTKVFLKKKKGKFKRSRKTKIEKADYKMEKIQ